MNISYSAKGLAASYRLGLIGSTDFRNLAGNVNSGPFFSERLLKIYLMNNFDENMDNEINIFINDEMGIDSVEKALECYVVFISLKIKSDPSFSLDGANMIWTASIKSGIKNTHDFDTFIYAASEIPSRPEMASKFIEDIQLEAKSWADRESNDPAYYAASC
jgi:hypothetical protein